MQPAKEAELASTVTVMAVDVKNCRVLGPMDAGIVVGPDARSIRVTESLFAGTGVGIGVRVESRDAVHHGVLLGNNTFHNLESGVVFTGLPKPESGSDAYGLRRNLFADVSVAAVSLQNGTADALLKFFPANGVGLNYTTAADAGSGGVNVFGQDNGKTGVAVKFHSAEPPSGQFLVPQSASLPKADAKPVAKIGNQPISLKNWVGARQPK
jgi:hypothetical protein